MNAIRPAFLSAMDFSTLWKNIFHCVEKPGKSFPLCGKTGKKFSIAWKNREKVFHCVENFLRPRGIDFNLDILSQTIAPPTTSAAFTWQAGDFLRSRAGWIAKISRGLSDDGAPRTIRAVLVYASGRPRCASAEMTRLGFCAARTCKKYPFLAFPMHPRNPAA